MSHPRLLACSLLTLWTAACAAAAANDEPTRDQAKPFKLFDQFDKSHTIEFPREKPLVLSVADSGGSRDAPIWTDAIKEKYGDRIDFISIASLSFIPELGRGAAKLAIRATSKDPVLCDWDGAVTKALGAKKGTANIIVIAVDGDILHHVTGEATDEKRDAAYAVIDNAIESATQPAAESNPEITPVEP